MRNNNVSFLKILIAFVFGIIFSPILFHILIPILFIVLYYFTALIGFKPGEFDLYLGNDYMLVTNNAFDIHISDVSGITHAISVGTASRGVGRRPGVINIPEDEYETSLVVPPKIMLLGQEKNIVYGLNISVRQSVTPSEGLSAKYFGWFVLDTLECKCWVGLTEEEMFKILKSYHILNPKFQLKRNVLR